MRARRHRFLSGILSRGYVMREPVTSAALRLREGEDDVDDLEDDDLEDDDLDDDDDDLDDDDEDDDEE